MIQLRKSNQRGSAYHGWLKSFHTFSFAEYHDPAQMGFGPLRVINEDFIAGGGGFATHGHRNMEIITYVVSGELMHQDSMGNSAVIKPFEVQRMSAGRGVRHSEHNASKTIPTHLLQIWILPDQNEIEPSYEQKSFIGEDLILVASNTGRENSVRLSQDVDMYAMNNAKAGSCEHLTNKNRKLWLQVVKGGVTIAGQSMVAGDGAGIENIETLALNWTSGSDFILFDMTSD
jgi:quercetin 2,3-dioxygenase